MTPPSFTSGELADRFGLELRGDAGLRIDGVATLARAEAGQLAFLANSRYRAQLAPQPDAAAEPAAPHARHILLVEDNGDARAMTSELLAMLGHVVRQHIAATRTTASHASECTAVGVDPHGVGTAMEFALGCAPFAAPGQLQAFGLVVTHRLGEIAAVEPHYSASFAATLLRSRVMPSKYFATALRGYR